LVSFESIDELEAAGVRLASKPSRHHAPMATARSG
jgi:hypothetical protein